MNILKKICAQNVNEAKSLYYDVETNTDTFCFWLKLVYYDARKLKKNIYFNTWPNQNHNFMMPKKADIFDF